MASPVKPMDWESVDHPTLHRLWRQEEGVRWLMRRFAQGMELRPRDDIRGWRNCLQREFSPLLIGEDGSSGDNNLSS
jgi:hypothetical protein